MQQTRSANSRYATDSAPRVHTEWVTRDGHNGGDGRDASRPSSGGSCRNFTSSCCDFGRRCRGYSPYREGLAEALGRQPDIAVMGAASSEPTDVERTVRCRPDVVVVDMAMPTGTSITRGLSETAPQVKVVGLGVPVTATHVLACAENGVVGCVAREGSLKTC